MNCTDCGSHKGSGWGYCPDCTPVEYLDLAKQRITLQRKAREYAAEQLSEARQALEILYLSRNGGHIIERRMDHLRDEHEAEKERKKCH